MPTFDFFAESVWAWLRDDLVPEYIQEQRRQERLWKAIQRCG